MARQTDASLRAESEAWRGEKGRIKGRIWTKCKDLDLAIFNNSYYRVNKECGLIGSFNFIRTCKTYVWVEINDYKTKDTYGCCPSTCVRRECFFV